MVEKNRRTLHPVPASFTKFHMGFKGQPDCAPRPESVFSAVVSFPPRSYVWDGCSRPRNFSICSCFAKDFSGTRTPDFNHQEGAEPAGKGGSSPEPETVCATCLSLSSSSAAEPPESAFFAICPCAGRGPCSSNRAGWPTTPAPVFMVFYTAADGMPSTMQRPPANAWKKTPSCAGLSG